MDNTSPFQPWASDDSAKNVKSERDVVDDAKLHRENVNHPKHRQTASYDKESVAVPSLTPGTSSAGGSGTDPARSKESKMDSSKVASMQQIVENTLSQDGRQRVSQLLEAVEALSGAERLLLYLRLPTGVPPHDPLKQPMNPLGSRAELQQTVIWIQTHLEVDPDVSLPKQDVYDEYIAHCMSCNTKPLSTADFGKVMKQVYPTVRPRRLGTRGNSRYCYAGLRKKIKLEVPQLPDLGESSSSSSSKEPDVASRETERVVCDWAEAKLGVKFGNISDLARLLMAGSSQHVPSGPPPSISPPPLTPAPGLTEEQANRQLMSRLKRKMQGTQGSPGRPKKNKGQELAGESPPSTSYVSHHPPLKHESENIPGETIPGYGYQPTYMPMYERPPFPPYPAPRAHPTHSPHGPHMPHPSHSPHGPHMPHGPHPSQTPHPPMPMHDYRQDPYAFETSYARDLSVTVSSDVGHNLPINLSSDASLDLSTERGDWQRRRPPEPPPPPRLSLPGKKLILETYHSENRSLSPRSLPPEVRAPVQPQHEEFPRTEYLPKKMRAAEILGGKLARIGHTSAATADVTPPPAPAASSLEPSVRPEAAFLEDPKNLMSRSKSTAAALAREEQEAASPTRARAPSRRRALPAPPAQPAPSPPDACCGLGGINIKSGIICAEKHTEILNRERVISICNIDKHDLDDYLNEGSSQEHEEELVQYFHHKGPAPAPASDGTSFLETQDGQDDHSQGKNEKISQLRELLAKNLKNQSGSSPQTNQESQGPAQKSEETLKSTMSEGSFKSLVNEGEINGTPIMIHNEVDKKNCNSDVPVMNGNSSVPYVSNGNQLMSNVGPPHLYNGHRHNEPQSPTSRTQQYDFVPISDGCHSPGNFNSKSPLGFGARGHSPTKVNKQIIMGGSLQTSPISRSTAASPFVSPRNTPVPRSRFCSRPIPKLNGRKRRNPLSLGMTDPKQFAIPNDQKFIGKAPMCGPVKYCQLSAPPSPNIISQYKNQMYNNCGPIPSGNNLCLNFLPNQPFRDHMNGDQPLSADPLSSEVSQFFQETVVTYSRHDAFRSQSVPLKHAMNNIAMLSYNNTPVGSVPPTPIPNEFCDFGSLADTCDLTRAGLNRETLDKIYNAIDSNNDVLSAQTGQNILSANDTLSNGCDPLPEQPLLSEDHLTSLIPTGDDLLDRSNQFNQSFASDAATDNVEEFLKRANSLEFELNDLVDKNKYYASRSVPSTPLPYKRPAPNLQIDSRRSRELFSAENNYSTMTNGISSKSVPSTPQFVDEKSFFGFSNRDFLINGNSVSASGQIHETVVDNNQGLTSPLHDMLREDILAEPLTPALLADLDKMDGAPYVDL